MWEKAKDNNDYEMFKPYLKKVINLTKEYYGYISDGKNLYDTMLNEFESGITSEVIDKLFNELKNALIPIMPGKKNKKNLEIYKIGKDLNSEVNSDLVIGRDKEINEIIETLLRKNKNKLPEGFVRKTSDPYNLYGYTIMQQTLKLQLRN